MCAFYTDSESLPIFVLGCILYVYSDRPVEEYIENVNKIARMNVMRLENSISEKRKRKTKFNGTISKKQDDGERVAV